MTPQSKKPSNEEIEREVGNQLMGDLGLLAAQQRGILDPAAIAREIVESHDWEAAEREVTSAIRRFTLPEEFDLDEACKLLDRAPVSTGNNLALLEVETSADELDGLPGICELLRDREPFGLKQEGELLSVLIPERILDNAIEHLGLSREQIRTDLGYIHLKFPEGGTPMALAVCTVMRLLHQENVEVVEANKTRYELTLIIPYGSKPKAFGLIMGLKTSRSETDGEEAR